MKKDDIKTLIVVIIVCAIITGVILLLNYKSNSEKMKSVNDYNTYFSTNMYINNYINLSNITDREKINSILYSNYSENYDMFDSTLKSKNNNLSIKTEKMKYVKIGDNYLYYVKGKIMENDFDSIKIHTKNYEIIVLYDYNELTYAIYPVINNDANEIIDNIKKIHIEKNDYNKLQETELIRKEKICTLYVDDYVNYLNTNVEKAYKLLSSTMKKKQFTNIDKFEEYINKNINKITTTVDKCKLTEVDGDRVYTVIDNNDNKYIFKEKNVLEYEVDIYITEKEENIIDNKKNIKE